MSHAAMPQRPTHHGGQGRYDGAGHGGSVVGGGLGDGGMDTLRLALYLLTLDRRSHSVARPSATSVRPASGDTCDKCKVRRTSGAPWTTMHQAKRMDPSLSCKQLLQRLYIQIVTLPENAPWPAVIS
jgi:hypothetical protein